MSLVTRRELAFRWPPSTRSVRCQRLALPLLRGHLSSSSARTAVPKLSAAAAAGRKVSAVVLALQGVRHP